MATITNVEEFEAFKKARELARAVYAATRQREFARDFGLVDQIRRASVSVVSNMAEGFERDGRQEFIQFLAVSKGSVGEVKAQLLVAMDQNYLTEKEGAALRQLATETGRLIAGLMHYLRQSEYRGAKFRKPETSNSRPETSSP